QGLGGAPDGLVDGGEVVAGHVPKRRVGHAGVQVADRLLGAAGAHVGGGEVVVGHRDEERVAEGLGGGQGAAVQVDGQLVHRVAEQERPQGAGEQAGVPVQAPAVGELDGADDVADLQFQPAAPGGGVGDVGHGRAG